jgi:hypothetical protein
MSDNPEFYPLDFPHQVVVSPEELMARLESRITQSFFQQITYQRKTVASQIATEKAKIITGDRLPSPSVMPNLYELDIANQNATVEQFQEVVASIMGLMIQVQQWQSATLEPLLCNDVTAECSD